jgi:hypothetical protein
MDVRGLAGGRRGDAPHQALQFRSHAIDTRAASIDRGLDGLAKRLGPELALEPGGHPAVDVDGEQPGLQAEPAERLAQSEYEPAHGGAQ